MVQPEANQTERLIAALKALPEGWDGPESVPVASIVLDKIQPVLTDVEVCGMPRPDILPRSDGSVELIWTSRARDLRVQFLPVGLIVSLQTSRLFDKDDQLISSTDHSHHFADYKPIDRLMAWFIGEVARA